MWYNKILRNPDGEEGGDEGKDLKYLEGAEGEDAEGEEKGGEETVETPPPAATGLTKEDITGILAEVIPAAQAPQQQERQYTREEVDKMLNVWNADTAFLKKLGIGEPTADNLAALHEMRDKLILQSQTLMDARMQQYVKEQLKDVEALRAYVTEQQAAATVNSFFEKNPDLKQYEEIVDAVSLKMEKNGFTAKNQSQAFDEIAKGTREVLKRMGVKVEAKPAAARNGSRMTTLTGGGQGAGTGSAKKRNPDMAIFDDPDE